MSDKSSGFTDKLKGLFFKSNKKAEEISINKNVWEKQEGVKWVYFKERADEKIIPEETLSEDYTGSIIKQQLDRLTEKQETPDISVSEVPDETATFSVGDFAKKFGDKTRYGEAVDKTGKEKPSDASGVQKDKEGDSKLELEKRINYYIQKLEVNPDNIDARRKLAILYLETQDYSRALGETFNIICKTPDASSGFAFSGSIKFISPFYVFQILINSKQSGRVTFYLAWEEASVYFLQGKAVHAEDRWGKGEEVIKRVLSWREGNFSFNPTHLSFELSLTKPIEKILSQFIGFPMKTSRLSLEDIGFNSPD